MNLGMTLRISSDVIDRIIAEAARFHDREVCGLLFGSAGLVSGMQSCRNVARDPAATFEIDPQQLVDAHRAARAGGPAVIGCYHSHPSGVAVPSMTDAALAAADQSIWLIAAGRGIGAWRAVERGRIHDRFDSVTFEPVAGDLVVGKQAPDGVGRSKRC